jgi:hypothetical protein
MTQLSPVKVKQIEQIANIFRLEPDRLVDALIKVGFEIPEEKKANFEPQPIKLTPEQKVKAIEEKALNQGWTYKKLWNKPKTRDYSEMGLICFVDDLTIVGEVTNKHISLIHEKPTAGPVILNFYNNKTDQPWIKKISRTVVYPLVQQVKGG